MHRLDRRAFTLIELLVVVAIIGILAGLTLAGVQRVRSVAARIECSNNLKQIALALQHYHGLYRVFPPGCSYQDGRDPHPHMSWMTRLLPLIEHEAIWREAEQAFAKEAFFLKVPPHTALGRVIPIYTCPADDRSGAPAHRGNLQIGLTSYLGVNGIDQFTHDGILYVDSRVRIADVSDGTSHTLLVGERPPSADLILGWWYAGWGQRKNGSGDSVLGVRELNSDVYGPGCFPGPYYFVAGKFSNQCDAFHFWSPHSGGANFAFVDGSVRFLSYSTDALMPALATRAGGEPVAIP
ncbi:MAG: DUF1559 domain-containing protein [Gemmataceae bacterium]|nr:DUF1559 domain-containing protein [Gemmataceae bacterium]